MVDINEHFKRLKWLSSCYADEVEMMRQDKSLDKNAELDIKLGSVLFAQNEVLKHIKESKNGNGFRNN